MLQFKHLLAEYQGKKRSESGLGSEILQSLKFHCVNSYQEGWER
jgi:hypothetical protein